jgi:hypothetical protein
MRNSICCILKHLAGKFNTKMKLETKKLVKQHAIVAAPRLKYWFTLHNMLNKKGNIAFYDFIATVA